MACMLLIRPALILDCGFPEAYQQKQDKKDKCSAKKRLEFSKEDPISSAPGMRRSSRPVRQSGCGEMRRTSRIGRKFR